VKSHESLTVAAASRPLALDQQGLFVSGLERVRRLARNVWTDHNLHDPGITILELLTYVLTDVIYRARFEIRDLLTGADPADDIAHQFFTARRILPNRPWTVSDYRKLLIDLEGVRNAWLRPKDVVYYAQLTYDVAQVTGQLTREPGGASSRRVTLRGLYDVLIEFMDPAADDATKQEVLAEVRRRLNANRNLCEDFEDIAEVTKQDFVLCGELELAPDADLVEVNAQILYRVQQALEPAVRLYTLDEMRLRPKPDKSLYTVEEIFAGPDLQNGFIDDAELEAAELPTELHLSDIIRVVMEIPGVNAVRDMVLRPAQNPDEPLANKWVIPVLTGQQPTLSSAKLVFYKGRLPVKPVRAAVDARYDALMNELRQALEGGTRDDRPVQAGRHRAVDDYASFQRDFPAIYGLREGWVETAAAGLGAGRPTRAALAYQLKAYLLLFEQVMANCCAQLGHIRHLFSIDPNQRRTYFSRVVDSFPAFERVYADASPAVVLDSLVETADGADERRNRFLDHLIARYGERLHDYAEAMRAVVDLPAADLIRHKCEFLKDYPAIGGERSLAYDHSLTSVWDSDNVSGFERRLARLLDIPSVSRRSLSASSEEGMYVIENILLRPMQDSDPFLPICVDPTCVDCVDDDPYSYRLHVILPAYAGQRFPQMGFRRFVEHLIREETPAHILPKICWVDKDDMGKVESAYKKWLEARAGAPASERQARLAKLIEVLMHVKNVYPPQQLGSCEPDETQPRPKFILGRSALGTEE